MGSSGNGEEDIKEEMEQVLYTGLNKDSWTHLHGQTANGCAQEDVKIFGAGQG